MQILFYDAHIIVCQKAAGELSEGEGASALPTLLAEAMAEEGEQPAIYPVHRLDRETVGVMVFARTRQAAASLSAALNTDAFSKEYLALCHGRLEEDAATLTDLLFYDRRRGKSFVVDRPRAGVKEAVKMHISQMNAFARLSVQFIRNIRTVQLHYLSVKKQKRVIRSILMQGQIVSC